MAVINHYHENMPGVKELAQNCKAEAEDLGYIETFTGRRIRFPNKRYAYKASGLKIQATAADINKLTWILAEEALDGVGYLVLNTHDSYGLSVKEDTAIRAANSFKTHVEINNVLKVPVILEVKEPGKNWWQSTNGKRIL
jgi:DNA polymerase I-like protein with 3'-5' exonuclease and polymerase domains